MADRLVLTDTQQARLAIAEVDRRGNPVTPGDEGFGTITWTTSDPSVVTVTSSADGASATVVAAGSLGTAQISASADVGGQPLTGTLDVQVVAGAAASIKITADAPQEQ